MQELSDVYTKWNRVEIGSRMMLVTVTSCTHINKVREDNYLCSVRYNSY